MGTRHSIEVKLDNEIKVAQYGQWDGYYIGQGADIARFIHNKMDKEIFKEKLRECSFLTDEEISYINVHESESWRDSYPWLSRDAGAEVLEYIQSGQAKKLLADLDFKNDDVFCEFYYLIDMDNETVSVNNLSPIPFSDWTEENMKLMEEAEV